MSLNDPFETMAGVGHARFDHALGEFSRSQEIERSYKILCLTRDPLNSIMWSHYAEQHHGMVIGIDSELAGLENEDNCILPAQYGSMIYTRTKPNFKYGNKNDFIAGQPIRDHFNPKIFNFIQRNFLFKSAEWHYEEEVRIIKTTHSLTGLHRPDLVPLDAVPTGATFEIPTEAIREIYLGHRFYIDWEGMENIFSFLKHVAPNAEIFDAYRDKDSWRMSAEKIIDWREHLQQVYDPRY